MTPKENARSLAKVTRAHAVISELIVAHPFLGALVDFAKALLFCLGLWALMWLCWFAFGDVAHGLVI